MLLEVRNRRKVRTSDGARVGYQLLCQWGDVAKSKGPDHSVLRATMAVYPHMFVSHPYELISIAVVAELGTDAEGDLDTVPEKEKHSWSLLAAWGGDENATLKSAPPNIVPHLRINHGPLGAGLLGCASPLSGTSLAGDSDDESEMRSESTARRMSPGALLRLQSASTVPTPHPLSDLMRLRASQHQIPMVKIIHSMASLSRAGKERSQKKNNQDSSFAFRQFVQPHQAIAGVFDGHGPNGHAVSRFVKKQLPAAIAEQLKTKGEVAVHAVLRSAFIETHEALRYAPDSINARLSGSTAVVTLLQGKRITAAWVGDSRAIVIRRELSGGWRGVPLTEDHKPTSSGELTRILASGGRVERLTDAAGREIGPHRIWLPGAWVPGLAMSRAMGDFVAHSVGVVADPEIMSHELDDQDAFLVLASDGVWEFMSIQDVADAVSSTGCAEDACRVIVQMATNRWNEVGEGVTDDITVVCTRFHNLST